MDPQTRNIQEAARNSNAKESTNTMKFRKKPVVIEAVQFNPEADNFDLEYWNVKQRVYKDYQSKTGWSCDTLEGKHEVTPGDWIITGIKGEKYPCKPDIFDKTYEKVEE